MSVRSLPQESFPLMLLLWVALTVSVVPVEVEMNDNATLPCHERCDGEVLWQKHGSPPLTVANYSKPSYHVKEGYKLPQEKVQDGDLSLTINSADHSNEGIYICSCGSHDYCEVKLTILPHQRTFQTKAGQNLTLDLLTSDPVTVTFTRSGVADAEAVRIYTVKDHNAQSLPDYQGRVSVSKSILVLRELMLSDSGVYTVTEVKGQSNIISIYNVTVSGSQKGVNTHRIYIAMYEIPVLLFILGVVLISIVCWRRASKKRSSGGISYQDVLPAPALEV